MRRFAIAVFALFVLGTPFAQVVSLRFVENPFPVSDTAIPFTEAITTGLMDRLYESGLIATSDSILRGREPSRADVVSLLADARAGYVDFVVAVYADYRVSAFKSGLFYPVSFAYFLLDVGRGEIVAEGTIEGASDRDDFEREGVALMKRLGKNIAEVTDRAVSGGKGE